MHTRLYLCFYFALPVRIVSIHLTRFYLVFFFFFCFFYIFCFGATIYANKDVYTFTRQQN